MTTYTKRDIRAADILAMVLVGLGVLVLLLAALPLGFAQLTNGGASRPGLWIAGGVFVLLGTALNLKIRQLARNAGRESEDHPGVPE